MRFLLRIRRGRRALGVGIFYHADKHILYVHPVPFFAVVIYFGEWVG